MRLNTSNIAIRNYWCQKIVAINNAKQPVIYLPQAPTIMKVERSILLKFSCTQKNVFEKYLKLRQFKK